MITYSIAIIFGSAAALGLGLLCGRFLTFTVNITLPPDYQYLDPQTPEFRRGGFWLGLMECMLFFTSFWLGEHVLAGGWLIFKVAAKWAVWQHVTRMPSDRISNDPKTDLEFRSKVGSLQLGRFLNGTLYNGCCGVIGYVVARVVLVWIDYMRYRGKF